MDTIKHNMRRIKSAFLTKFYPWFKEMTRIMIKSYFVITIFFAMALFATKEPIPLHEVAFAGVYFGYINAITYWLLKQEVMSEKWTNTLHFSILFIVFMLSGSSVGSFSPIVNFILFEYWVIRGIQTYFARKNIEKVFNIGFHTVKDRWHNNTIETDERSERFRML